MKAGAEILVRTCAGVQPGEEVVMVSDPERRPIAEALMESVAEAGGLPPSRPAPMSLPGAARVDRIRMLSRRETRSRSRPWRAPQTSMLCRRSVARA